MGEAKAKPRAWSRRRERYNAAIMEMGDLRLKFEGWLTGERRKKRRKQKAYIYIQTHHIASLKNKIDQQLKYKNRSGHLTDFRGHLMQSASGITTT